MPTANGPIGNPRYDAQDPPVFPAHLTAVSDFFAGLATPVNLYSDLAGVQGKFAGMLKSDLQTGGLWLYNGTAWTRLNKLVAQGGDNYSNASTGSGATAVSFSFAALPFPTQINLQALGQGGFRTAASQFTVLIAATGGTLSQSDNAAVNAPAASMVGFSKGATLNLAPNVSSVVTFKCQSSDNPYLRVDAQYTRVCTQ